MGADLTTEITMETMATCLGNITTMAEAVGHPAATTAIGMAALAENLVLGPASFVVPRGIRPSSAPRVTRESISAFFPREMCIKPVYNVDGHHLIDVTI